LKVINARVVSVLTVFPEALISKLFEEASSHNLREGETLFHAGDAADGAYRLQNGLLKIIVASQYGEERIVALLGPGAIVGELSMIDGGARSASAVALGDCSLLFVSRDKFQKYAASHPQFMTDLSRILARRLRDADDALAATTFLTVKGRLARALLNLAVFGQKKDGGRIELRHKISQSDLAAMAGVARENVSRTLSEWRKRDIVTRSSDYYCIIDSTALAREMEASD